MYPYPPAKEGLPHAPHGTIPPTNHHHRARDQARVRIGGKDIYLGAYASAEANEAYARLVAELAAGGGELLSRGRAPVSVAGLVSEWEKGMARRFAETSR
jgi:hypothetical protein